MTVSERTVPAEDTPRVEILNAAAELFMDLGFAATTIDAIAERLGATKGRVYHHFDSKAEIYFEIQRAAMSSLQTAVEPIARSGGPARDRLARMAERHVGIMLRELPIQKVAVQGLEVHLFRASGLRHSRTLREIVRLRDDYEELFCEVIDEGVRDGVFEDLPARSLSKPFFGALNWLTIWYRPRRLQTEADLQAIVSMLSTFAMRGIMRDMP